MKEVRMWCAVDGGGATMVVAAACGGARGAAEAAHSGAEAATSPPTFQCSNCESVEAVLKLFELFLSTGGRIIAEIRLGCR
ncbi:hypothetical protein Hanom_Chr09g00775061 [Helianthus anomalus]